MSEPGDPLLLQTASVRHYVPATKSWPHSPTSWLWDFFSAGEAPGVHPCSCSTCSVLHDGARLLGPGPATGRGSGSEVGSVDAAPSAHTAATSPFVPGLELGQQRGPAPLGLDDRARRQVRGVVPGVMLVLQQPHVLGRKQVCKGAQEIPPSKGSSSWTVWAAWASLAVARKRLAFPVPTSIPFHPPHGRLPRSAGQGCSGHPGRAAHPLQQEPHAPATAWQCSPRALAPRPWSWDPGPRACCSNAHH